MNKEELTKQEELINNLMETTVSPVCFISDDKIIKYNRVFQELLGIERIEKINDGSLKFQKVFIQKLDFFGGADDIATLIKTENTLSMINQEGVEQTFLVRGKELKENNCLLLYLQNITQRLEYENELLKLLYTDSNTELPNRTKLIDELQKGELDITSISLIDVKSFKEINDFYGHRIGDQVLREIGNIIRSEVQKIAELKLYKFPSDIYCVTNTAYDKELFETTITHIVDLIDKEIFHFQQHEINARVTAGISFSEKNNKLITADLALQAAKRDNKDYLVFYEELDNLQEYENNMKWTKKVKTALKEDNIVVFYQPLINNKTMKADKYECLVRMKDGDKIVSPFFFLDVSKKSNQYVHITKIVIEKACKKFSNLTQEFSVNISYEDIEDPSFFFFIEEMVKKYGVEKRIVFEILEDENVKNYDVLIDFIDKIKKLGCKVAIDDFGSGYSNFEHLLKMKVDYLKIDASLIKNIATDESSYKITKTIVDFAQSLNLKTIAEFVENKEIFEIVKDLDCNFSQGYYFSAPLEDPDYTFED